nr:transposase family protein [Streptomyces sp. AcE210]
MVPALADRVLVVAVYYRTNLAMRQLAPLFGCSPVRVCRVIQRLRPLLAIEQSVRPADVVERLWIVDGTLIRSVTGRSVLPRATTGSRQTCRSSSTPTPGWSLPRPAPFPETPRTPSLV